MSTLKNFILQNGEDVQALRALGGDSGRGSLIMPISGPIAFGSINKLLRPRNEGLVIEIIPA